MYRDVWILNNKGIIGVQKETLALWVSKALHKALTAKNIVVGFRTTGIHPLNNKAMGSKMGHACAYNSLGNNGEGSDIHIEEVLAYAIDNMSI